MITATYTRREIVAMLANLDRDGLNALCLVVNEEIYYYNVFDWVQLRAAINHRYYQVQCEEIKALNSKG
jgi:hypothetical protein